MGIKADTVTGTQGLKMRFNLECLFVQNPFPLPFSRSQGLVPVGTLNLLPSICIYWLSDQHKNLLPASCMHWAPSAWINESWALTCPCSLSVVPLQAVSSPMDVCMRILSEMRAAGVPGSPCQCSHSSAAPLCRNPASALRYYGTMKTSFATQSSCLLTLYLQ